ncbi:MAG: hypothetical protein WC562_08560 [Dehalococcoidia bacterium]
MKDMTGKQWLTSFKKHYCSNIKCYEEGLRGHKEEGREWTRFILSKIVEPVGEDFGCYVIRQGKKNVEESGEYLHIDALFLDDSIDPELYNKKSPYNDPRILPEAAIEHENSTDFDKISFCLWKLLCVRTRLRVLICYQSNSRKMRELIKHLEQKVSRGKLMKGEGGDLIVIVGNEEHDDDAQSFEKYYRVFQWQGDGLKEVV